MFFSVTSDIERERALFRSAENKFVAKNVVRTTSQHRRRLSHARRQRHLSTLKVLSKVVQLLQSLEFENIRANHIDSLKGI